MLGNSTKYTSGFDAMRPFVDRALHDDQIKTNVFKAFTAARKVYEELGGEGPLGAASKLSSKDSVRDELDTTVQSLSEAIVRMSGKEPKRRGHWGLFAFIALALVILFNPATGAGTRRWLKDNLLGSEEEFDYTTPNY